MERNEVSIHEVRLYVALQERGSKWSSSNELADAAKIAGRTARAHLVKLVSLGVIDVAEVFPAHRYRIAEKADKRNAAYVNRLKAAREAFGL